MIKGKINIPLYNCSIIVCFEDDINPLAKRLCKKYKIEFEDTDEDYHTVVPTDTVAKYYMLFSPPNLTQSYFTHEVVHLGTIILSDRGHPLTNNDEPHSHLCGYIAGEIEKIMLRNSIELIKPKIRKKKDGKTIIHPDRPFVA